MATPNLTWNKCRADSWCDIFAINLDSLYFIGLEGIYIIWHGGESPQALQIGQGLIRERIEFHQRNPEILHYKAYGLYATWAKVDASLRNGVERFLAESLHPRISSSLTDAAPLAINLPNFNAPPAKTPGASKTEQPWEYPQETSGGANSGTKSQTSAPPASAHPSGHISNLQRLFNEQIKKAQTPGKTGFFGGTAVTKEAEEFVVNTFQMILKEALAMRASDVHIEPLESGLRVRLRIDGLLEPVLEIPKALNLRLVSYIRVTCGLDPEKGVGSGKPEDGRMVSIIGGKKAEMRLSTFPTAYGEKIVLRLIQGHFQAPNLPELGISSHNSELILDLLRRPQGMIIVSGPTGSGKTTTLYTLLQALNDVSRNIVTLEDPIELNLPGITQGMLQPKVGFTFAEGLRSVLRQDPNIIMIGEIRDSETAEIAMSAALTGHLILTSLHTPSAVGAIVRLLDMGSEPFLIASALTAVFAQRLARRICATCRESYPVSQAELAQIGLLAKHTGIKIEDQALKTTYRGKGCQNCRQTGYQGRVLIFEAIQITPQLRQLILNKSSLEEMQKAAIAGGAQPMLMDGLFKVAGGITTLSEIVRVVGAAN